MEAPSPKPRTRHLNWPRPEAADLGQKVEQMMESDAWKALVRSVEERLTFEQRLMMAGQAPREDRTQTYERIIGQWGGLRDLEAMAEGIVAYGKEAAREMNEPEQEAASG